MLPNYEKQVIGQVEVQVTKPHENQVRQMLDSFNTDLLSLQERISNQQEVTVKLIHKEL